MNYHTIDYADLISLMQDNLGATIKALDEGDRFQAFLFRSVYISLLEEFLLREEA